MPAWSLFFLEKWVIFPSPISDLLILCVGVGDKGKKHSYLSPSLE